MPTQLEWGLAEIRRVSGGLSSLAEIRTLEYLGKCALSVCLFGCPICNDESLGRDLLGFRRYARDIVGVTVVRVAPPLPLIRKVRGP